MLSAGPRRGPVPRHHRLRRRRLQLRRRRDGRPSSARRCELDKAPLKYDGLSYTEIWISEVAGADGPGRAAGRTGTACRRCAPARTSRRRSSAASRRRAGCGCATRGSRSPTSTCTSCTTAGRAVVRQATLAKAQRRGGTSRRRRSGPPSTPADFTDTLKQILALARTCAARNGSSASTTTRCRAAASSSRWSASPTTAPATRPSSTPVLGSWAGLAVGCGINPRYGDLDPYAMAAAAIDEAVRNVVAVGADPRGSRCSTISAGATPTARGARLAGARGRGVPRRGPGLRHAVHQRQGQPQQRVPLRRTGTSSSRRRCSSAPWAGCPTCAAA